MASTESRHASKPSVSALEAARARMRKDDQSHEPRTPPPQAHHRNRSIVSSFGSSSSPLSSSFRNEEDAVILELGSRYLRAGFEGESMPMCTVEFGPEQSRKAGDYRGWMKPRESAEGAAVFLDADEWTRNHELWQMDLREMDLGLVCDKLERAVREIYNNYLLTDAGTARLVLVIPSIMPHPLLTVVLETLFDRWRFPSITLMPSAAMVAAAAGVRAALVVDIGWAETTATAVYEYRDIASKRSSRATKGLVQGMGNMLSHLDDANEEKSNRISVDFNYCEEVVSRLTWCKIEAEDEYRDRDVSIPSPSHNASDFVQVPFSHFAKPVEEVFFAQGTDERELDDQEKPIHVLVYNVLLQLPPDLRGPCMSRMIFVGGGSRIPGIRQRVLNEVSALVSKYGWDATRGRAVEEQRKRIQQLELTRKHVNVPEVSGVETTSEPDLQSTEAEAEAEAEEKEGDKEPEEVEDIDFIEQKIRRNQSRNSKPFIQGQFRQVESLGAWAGASLVSSLKIRGLVEIDREKFLRDGLAGASRDVDGLYQAAERRAGVRSSVVSDRSSWTLAGWG